MSHGTRRAPAPDLGFASSVSLLQHSHLRVSRLTTFTFGSVVLMKSPVLSLSVHSKIWKLITAFPLFWLCTCNSSSVLWIEFLLHVSVSPDSNTVQKCPITPGIPRSLLFSQETSLAGPSVLLRQPALCVQQVDGQCGRVSQTHPIARD